jgi:hypothetical protein
MDVARQMNGLLGRRGVRPVRARVTFSDEDGPRGGIAIRCALTVRLPGRPSIRVEHQARTYRQAFQAGFETLKRQIKRTTRRRRQSGRVPKKHDVARRLREAPRDATRQDNRRTS